MEIKDKIADLLRFEGIECKGFGILPKFVMQDQDISIGAKALYAYYCSLAGAEYVTFPRRETILKQLKINKETFYKIQKELCVQGYIKVTQERTTKMNFSRNIYTLVQSPTKFIEHVKNQDSLQMQSEHNKYDAAYMQGLKSTGYGIIPRIVMQDPRLELKAKAIYAYYVVYTGAGKLSHIKRDIILHHLGISKNTYNKYMQVLVQLNYITIQQQVDHNGRFCANNYVLNNKPQFEATNQVEPCTKKPDTDEIEPCTKKPDTDEIEPCTKKPDTDEIEPRTKKPDTDEIEPCTKKPDTDEIEPCTKIPDTDEIEPCTKIPDTGKSTIISVLEPCTKKPDTGETVPCTKIPDPVKPDTNNINIIYNTRSLINQSINIAIQQQDEEENEVDRWIEDWECGGIVFSPSHETTVAALPEGILPEKVIHTLTEYAHYTAHPYDSALMQSTYELFNDALIELCSTPNERNLRGSTVTYINVIRKINRLIAGKEHLEASMTFHTFMDLAIRDYINALKTTKITDNFKYMQSCIWSVLLTGEVRFHTMLLGAIEQP